VDSNDDIYFIVRKRSEKELGSTSKGVFFLKYNQQGDQLWSKQLDPEVKFVTGLTADDQGNIYVTGLADSTPQRKTKGEADACIAKYDQTGTQLWVRLLGTPSRTSAAVWPLTLREICMSRATRLGILPSLTRAGKTRS
jgi:hypothetical protein